MGEMPPVLVQPIKAVRRARTLRKAMSLPQVLVWVELQKQPGGFRFRREVPLKPYTLDFACLAARLVIEVDGEAHSMGDRPRQDAARDRVMAERGFRTLRLPAYEVLKNLEGCVQAIVEACRGNPPRNGEVARSDGGVPRSGKHGVAGKVGPLRPLEGAPPRAGEDL